MTWTLSHMRDLNQGDALPGLGRKIEPKPAPAPEPVRRPDGFIVGADGKLSTDLPPPAVPVWPFPSGKPEHPPPEPGVHGFMRIRVLIGGSGVDAGQEWFPDEVEGSQWERVA